MHQRQAIREKVCEVLVAADTVAGARVFPNRNLPVRARELPAILVYATKESVDDDSVSTAPRELTRRLELAIEGLIGVDDDVDDALDDIALQIETAMHADPYLAGQAGDSILKTTDIGVAMEGDRPLGLASLVYEVTYRTLAPEPLADSELDDFRRANTTTDLGGSTHEDDQAVDEVVVQEDPP